jgi:3-oxoacyl-[acyl-carrier-protein] synthase-1
MLDQGFVAGSANIAELDPKAEGLAVLRTSEDRPELTTVMSNNFGFGGTNACVVFQRPQG